MGRKVPRNAGGDSKSEALGGCLDLHAAQTHGRTVAESAGPAGSVAAGTLGGNHTLQEDTSHARALSAHSESGLWSAFPPTTQAISDKLGLFLLPGDKADPHRG